MGQDYAFLALQKSKEGIALVQVTCLNANRRGKELVIEQIPVDSHTLYLRAAVEKEALCNFSFSMDGKNFKPIGKPFAAKAGRWIGAKIGLFAVQPASAKQGGYAEYDFFRVE